MNDYSTELPTSVADEQQRRGQVVLRTLPILLIPVLVGLLTALLLHFTTNTPLPPRVGAREQGGIELVRIVVTVVFFTALIMLVRLGRPTASALLLIGAWTLVTTLAALQFGATSVIPALLIMPICAAGLLIDGAASVSLAALATLLVGSLAWLQLHGLNFPGQGLPILGNENLPVLAAGYWTAVFWTVAGLTWLLAHGLQRALQQSHAQAEALRQLSAQLEARVAEQTAELAQRTARAEALYEVSRALTSTLDLPQLLALITEHAARLLHFDSALVLLAEPEGSGFSVMGAYQQPLEFTGHLNGYTSALQALLDRGQPGVVRVPGNGSADRMEIPALAVPMHYGSNVAGLLMLLDASHNAQRGSDDLTLAQGLADQAAVAIADAQFLARAREAATLEERTRLAREIHDTLAQGLTGIVVQLGAAQRALQAAPEQAAEHLDLAQRMARESLAEARRSVWNLRSPALERGDLSDALQALVAQPLRPETTADFDQCGEPWPLSSAVESALLRVCQEALVNVAKHARATQVEVRLKYQPDAVRLVIQDNGVGFDETLLRQPPLEPGAWGGFGLLGMRERLQALGGTLELANDHGAKVVAEVGKG